MPKTPNIAIIGGTLWGNKGAEAMLVTTIGKLRDSYPNAKFYVYSYYPKMDKELLHDEQIKILSAKPIDLILQHFPFAILCWALKKLKLRRPDMLLPEPIASMSRCDLMIDISGISFSDGREIYLPFNVLVIWPAILLGVSVVKLSQAVGPFRNPLNRIAGRAVLSRCDMVFGRGEISGEYLRDLGLKSEKWKVAPDVAFLYEGRFSLSDENLEKVDHLQFKLTNIAEMGKVVIGISPSSLVNEQFRKSNKDYIGLFINLIREMGTEFHYVFLPNATRYGQESPRNNDLYVIDQIRQRGFSDFSQEIRERVDYVDYDINTKESRTLLSCCTGAITSRFHGMISCLGLKVPVLVIGWSHKYREVLAEFNLEEFALDFSDGDTHLLVTLNKLFTERETIMKKLSDNLPRVRRESESQFNEIRRFLS